MLIMLLAVEATAQDEKSKAILILDASGSMWGRIEGKPKIEIAREVIREILGDWNPSVALGLMAYGHREKGNCDDIETLIDVGSVDTGKIMQVVDAISPKGKTPLSKSVQQAAEKLQYTEEKATVILVSDGIETCDMDPCRVARLLDKKGIDFTTHVIGFDIKEGELDQLRCLAENTGGMFLSADNADELKSALSSAVKIVEKGPNLKLSAAIKQGGEPLTEGVSYRVYGAQPDQEGSYTQIASSNSSQASFRLPAGLYHVVAQFGQAEAASDINVVDDKPADTTIVINAGRLSLKAAETEGGGPLEDARFFVYESKQDGDGNRKQITSAGGTNPVFNLPVGNYHVVVKHGQTETGTDVEVKGGELINKVIVLNQGNLRVKAVMTEGGRPLEQVRFCIDEGAVNIEGKRKRVSGWVTGNPEKVFNLPVGPYHVSARYGGVEAAADVNVKGGELTDVTIVLGSGKLRLKAVEVEGGESLEHTSFTVYDPQMDAEGKRQKVDGTYGPKQPVFNLPVGRYHVVAKYDKAESAMDVEVKGGELTDITIVLGSGKLRLKAVEVEGGEPLEHTSFTVYDPQMDAEGKRRKVDGTYGPKQPIFNLPVGKYYVTAKRGDAEAGVEAEVKGGEVTDLTIVMGAGRLRVRAKETEDGAFLEKTRFGVYESRTDLEGKRKHINHDHGGAPIFKLPVGRYYVTAKRDHVEVGVDVEVKGGKVTDSIIVMNTGKLHLQAVASRWGTPLKEDVRYEVYEGEAGDQENPEQIYSRNDPTPTFILSEGDYHVKAQYGQAEVVEDVEVDAGELTEETIITDFHGKLSNPNFTFFSMQIWLNLCCLQ